MLLEPSGDGYSLPCSKKQPLRHNPILWRLTGNFYLTCVLNFNISDPLNDTTNSAFFVTSLILLLNSKHPYMYPQWFGYVLASCLYWYVITALPFSLAVNLFYLSCHLLNYWLYKLCFPLLNESVGTVRYVIIWLIDSAPLLKESIGLLRLNYRNAILQDGGTRAGRLPRPEPSLVKSISKRCLK